MHTSPHMHTVCMCGRMCMAFMLARRPNRYLSTALIMLDPEIRKKKKKKHVGTVQADLRRFYFGLTSRYDHIVMIISPVENKNVLSPLGRFPRALFFFFLIIGVEHNQRC